jgi:hypothetical protein
MERRLESNLEFWLKQQQPKPGKTIGLRTTASIQTQQAVISAFSSVVKLESIAALALYGQLENCDKWLVTVSHLNWADKRMPPTFFKKK